MQPPGTSSATSHAPVRLLAPADLADILAAAAVGRFPPDDGGVDLVAEPVGRSSGVLAFSAHFVVCAPVSAGWVGAHLDRDDFSASHSPAFLQALADEIGADIGAVDIVLVAPGAAPGSPDVADVAGLGLVEIAHRDHPRVRRALQYRDDVRVWRTADDAGHLIVGRGLTGRWEVAFEVDDAGRGRGMGRALATAALAMVGPGQPVFLQVSPGNVASLRAVLAVGYQPMGAEVMLPPSHSDGAD